MGGFTRCVLLEKQNESESEISQDYNRYSKCWTRSWFYQRLQGNMRLLAAWLSEEWEMLRQRVGLSAKAQRWFSKEMERYCSCKKLLFFLWNVHVANAMQLPLRLTTRQTIFYPRRRICRVYCIWVFVCLHVCLSVCPHRTFVFFSATACRIETKFSPLVRLLM